MKRIVAAVGLTVASTTIAAAADLPARVYTKAPVAAQVYDWTGFYIGANVGVGVSRDPGSVVFNSSTPGGSSSVVGGAGVIGGGQLGYNWQAGNIVWGVEADFQGSSARDNRTCTLTCLTSNGTEANTYDQRLDWFGTVRGRVGWATGAVLGYVTGGLAYGGVRTNNTISVPDNNSPNNTNTRTFSWDQTRTGWTIGSGVEASLGGNWTGKIEYLYVDLGSQSGTGSGLPLTNTVTSSLDIREHIFRAGVNYRFGEKRIMATAPTADWRGLYLGGNAGEAVAFSPSSMSGFFSALGNHQQFQQEAYNLSPRGFIGGGQIGYNWQAGSLVYGLETDLQGVSQSGGSACLTLCDPHSFLATHEQRLNWLGTTRGRLGYATGDTLFYATGGLAYGKVTTKVSEADPFVTAQFDDSYSHTKTGYAVGGGIETKFDPFGLFGHNWSAKTEYLYVDLGKITDAYTLTPPGVTISHSFTSRVEEHIFRTGLNYHFASP